VLARRHGIWIGTKALGCVWVILYDSVRVLPILLQASRC